MTPRDNIRLHPLEQYERPLRDEPERDGPPNSWAWLIVFTISGMFWFAMACLAIMFWWPS